MPRQQAIKSRPQQLDLFQVQAEYPKEIVRNQSQEIDLDSLDLTRDVLICNVKKDNVEHFLDGTAKIYYTGKRFPPLLPSTSFTTSSPISESNAIWITMG